MVLAKSDHNILTVNDSLFAFCERALSLSRLKPHTCADAIIYLQTFWRQAAFSRVSRLVKWIVLHAVFILPLTHLCCLTWASQKLLWRTLLILNLNVLVLWPLAAAVFTWGCYKILSLCPPSGRKEVLLYTIFAVSFLHSAAWFLTCLHM